MMSRFFFFFQAEDGIGFLTVTGFQTWALPISVPGHAALHGRGRHGPARLSHLSVIHRAAVARQPDPDQAGPLPGAVVPRDRGSARAARAGGANHRRRPGPPPARAAPPGGAQLEPRDRPDAGPR